MCARSARRVIETPSNTTCGFMLIYFLTRFDQHIDPPLSKPDTHDLRRTRRPSILPTCLDKDNEDTNSQRKNGRTPRGASRSHTNVHSEKTENVAAIAISSYALTLHSTSYSPSQSWPTSGYIRTPVAGPQSRSGASHLSSKRKSNMYLFLPRENEIWAAPALRGSEWACKRERGGASEGRHVKGVSGGRKHGYTNVSPTKTNHPRRYLQAFVARSTVVHTARSHLIRTFEICRECPWMQTPAFSKKRKDFERQSAASRKGKETGNSPKTRASFGVGKDLQTSPHLHNAWKVACEKGCLVSPIVVRPTARSGGPALTSASPSSLSTFTTVTELSGASNSTACSSSCRRCLAQLNRRVEEWTCCGDRVRMKHEHTHRLAGTGVQTSIAA